MPETKRRTRTIKFVEADPTGLAVKRRQAAKACALCRRRKKRCVHEGSGQSRRVRKADNHDSMSPVQPTQDTITVHTTQPNISISLPHIRPLDSPQEDGASRFIGDLNPEHLLVEAISPQSSRDLSNIGGIGVWGHYKEHGRLPSLSPPNLTSIPTLQQVLASHIQRRCLPCTPPPDDWQALRRIYFDKLDPLFPVIGRTLLTQLVEGSVGAILAQQVICIAAATDLNALPYLRLRPHNILLSRQEFTLSLSTVVYATLEAGLLEDRLLLIRILCLFSMYIQPTSYEEADLPALIHSKTVHQMLTLGLHMLTDQSVRNYEQIRSLFLCVWCMDRLQTALYGRAPLINERDVGWQIDELISEQHAPFRLFLMVTRLLDGTIDLYRPNQNTTGELSCIDLPTLEQMILEAKASKLSSPLLSTIEVFYHSIVIVSYRYPPGENPAALPSRVTNSRRSLSANRITSIVRDEFPGDLSYVPTIPYAVSLSLSVAYREMRYSSVPMFKTRGRKAFTENAALLKDLGDAFWTAKIIAAMAGQVLLEMDKVLSSMAESGRQDTSEPRPDTQVPTPTSTTGSFRRRSATPENRDGVPVFDSAPFETDDVFGHFDPSFNLPAVDAAFQGNLDLGMSYNWFDWQQTWGTMDL